MALQELLDDLHEFVHLDSQHWSKQEVQLAWYPGGTKGYHRHFDAVSTGTFTQSSIERRRLTAIVYCSEGWKSEHGGELRLWPPGAGSSFIDVQPIAGRLLLFLSGCVPHMVCATHRDRVAVTMWMR